MTAFDRLVYALCAAFLVVVFGCFFVSLTSPMEEAEPRTSHHGRSGHEQPYDLDGAAWSDFPLGDWGTRSSAPPRSAADQPQHADADAGTYPPSGRGGMFLDYYWETVK